MIVLSRGSGRWPPLVGYDGTVAKGDYTPGPGRDLAVVGDDQQCQSFKVSLLEESHNLFTGLRIDCAGWLVGEKERGAVDEGAGDGHPLALSS
jgi:hypothetical protein